MSVSYTWVNWNRHKKVYDACIAGGVLLYVGVFFGVGKALRRPPNEIGDEILVIRALATCALVLLHVILCIGPLARIDRRFAALLYNRRHLGVTMFCVALAHAVLAIGYYGGFGVRNPLTAMIAGYGSITDWPFEFFGLVALVMLFLMAATSHDFWLANLSPTTWKSLHLCVYAAYVLVVMHVALGALRSERSLIYPILMGLGIVLVSGLHTLAAVRGRGACAAAEPSRGWIDVCSVDEIPEKRARIVRPRGGERIAVFRHDGKVSAVSNVCAHQAGPLGEGKVVDGCITCPWHGYQYLPESGRSPPPFTEKIPTYRVRVERGRVLVNPEALPPGTEVRAARIEQDRA